MSLPNHISRWSQRVAKGRFAIAALLAAPAVLERLERDGLRSALTAVESGSQRTIDLARRLAGRLSPDEARRAVAWAFRRAPHLEGECLQQSLVQYALQFESDGDHQFVIGVRNDGSGVGAHAWVQARETPAEGEPFAAILTQQPELQERS